ncbi:MAG: hypothetical protein IJ242_14520 [Clostridia bacterium]|nr:hypothetical protein [Clostridia bacterium]
MSLFAEADNTHLHETATTGTADCNAGWLHAPWVKTGNGGDYPADYPVIDELDKCKSCYFSFSEESVIMTLLDF